MFAAYLDASGNRPEHRIYTLSGFIATEDAWGEFSRQWEDVLSAYGVKQFHMTDLESGYGEFLGWSKDDRETFLRSLLSIIDGNTLASVSYGLSHEMYSKYVSAQVTNAVGGSPYFFLFLNAVLSAERLMDSSAAFGAPGFPHDWAISYHLAQGDPGSGALVQAYNQRSIATDEMWRATRTAAVVQTSANTARPFEAADLLAFEARKQVEVQLRLADRKPRYPFRALESSKRPRAWQFYEKPVHLIQNADIIERALLGKPVESLLTWED